MELKSTRELIIAILGNEFPSSLSLVTKEVRKHKKISTQAVHKILNELIQDKVAEKIDRQYMLSKAWLSSQTEAFSKYFSNYFNVGFNSKAIFPDSHIQVFKFETLNEMTDFILEAYLHGELSRKGGVYISLKRLHPLIPTSILSLLRKVAKENDIYVASEANDYAAKITAKLLKSLGIKVKLSADIPNRNSICFDECLLQHNILFPLSYKKKVHDFSDETEKKSKMSVIKMTADIFYKRANIYLTLIRDPVIIEDVKEKILGNFRVKK